jgi:UDP-3-O-[3-hydroxymyristoyl] glucosamine N-acyltransferase
MKLGQVASALGARLDNGSTDNSSSTLSSCAELEITGVAGIEQAVAGQITFVANPKYTALAKTTLASAVIVDEKFGEKPDESFPVGHPLLLRTQNPYLAFARAIELFYQPPKYAPGIHPTAVIHPSARIGEGAHIGPYAVVDADVVIGQKATLLAHTVIYPGARIGDNFFAHAHAVVRENCTLGNDVILQNGAVIGADGFGFAKDDSGNWHKIVQSGPAVLEDAVEVQANACVDRASVGETRIGRGVKIDNLAQVGHGSSVGENSLLCAQVGLAGSTDVGKRVILAGQVGIAGHCQIGDGVIATGQTGIHGDIPAGKILSGSPAMDNKLWLRCVVLFQRLPELAKALRAR